MSLKPSAEVVSLDHEYPGGIKALKNINLVLYEGTRTAIVGQNGSGKTTLSKHFNGLLRPTRGRVFVRGEDVAKKTTGELSRSVGYVFQNPNYQLFSSTVRDEISFGLHNIGMDAAGIKERTALVIEEFGLKPFANKQPLSLSSGIRKIIALASVYAMNPAILFLDEPTTGQDYKGKERIGELIGALAKKNHTVVIITHDMNFVARYTERAVVMAEGEIIADATPAEIFSRREITSKAHIEAPQSFALISALKTRGIKIEGSPLTPETAAEALIKASTEGEASRTA